MSSAKAEEIDDPLAPSPLVEEGRGGGRPRLVVCP